METSIPKNKISEQMFVRNLTLPILPVAEELF